MVQKAPGPKSVGVSTVLLAPSMKTAWRPRISLKGMILPLVTLPSGVPRLIG